MKNNHGGKREGAGRKCRGKTTPLYLRILPEYAERIKRESEEQGIPVGEVVERYMDKGAV